MEMLDLKPIVHSVLEQYVLPFSGTHGVSHWARVLENGHRLAELTGANVEVVRLFAVLHDARRVNEGIDDEHGRRAAKLAVELRGKWFSMSNADLDLLYEACASHTDGGIAQDVTVQTCWDSDRLDLGRVGICPDTQRLCTEAAKRPEILKWADGRACFQVVPELVKQDWGIDIPDKIHR